MKTEFEFLSNLKQRFKLDNIGDDCAILPKDAATDQVLTADLLVEDIDFRLKWTTPEFLGHKALAVSLSDIAAMGAKPVWSMLSLGIPGHLWETDFVERFYAGWFELAQKANVELVGGDISRTPEKFVIDSIIGGEVQKGQAVLRSGAQSGDLIFVSGVLGGASAGLTYLESGILPGSVDIDSRCGDLLLRQLKPNAQTCIGRTLGEQQIATSMIDISDGLSSDLFHLCKASGKGATIWEDKIPIDKNLDDSSEKLDILELVLHGGEDFELLFTANSKNSEKILKEISGEENETVTCIGEITENLEIIELCSNSGSRKLIPKGFQHFAEN